MKQTRINNCYLALGRMGRWIVCCADAEGAWSGARWVAHEGGIPTGGVQISNFGSREEAAEYALDAGLKIVNEGFHKRTGDEGECSITCYRCGLTSWNENDVRALYCGNCHEFHELEG